MIPEHLEWFISHTAALCFGIALGMYISSELGTFEMVLFALAGGALSGVVIILLES